MNKINAMFLATGNSSIQWWRIQSFVESAYRNQLANFVNPLWVKDQQLASDWQLKITDGEFYDPLFIRAFVPLIESGCINGDVVVCQIGHTEGSLELLESIKQRFPNLPILAEIDDNILSVPIYNEAFDFYSPMSGEARRIGLEYIKQCDGVIVSTPYLKDIYSEYNKNIWVVPNSIDFKLWDRVKRKAKSGIRIGWAGGSGHEGDILSIENAIKNITKHHRDVRFVFVNGPSRQGLPDSLKGIRGIEHHARWEPILKYPALLGAMDFDIYIAPVVDSAFNRGKSNLKWLEAAALSIPCVASNVGHFKETVKNGVDGLLADNEDEFEAGLESLISDKKLRNKMGAAANARVRKDFNIDKMTEHYISCLKEAIELKKAPVFIKDSVVNQSLQIVEG